MKKLNYNRQKALLAMIEVFGKRLGKIELQKYMFLYVQEYSDKKHYAFVPYRYGSFSYEMYKDLHTLERKGFLQIGRKEIKLKCEGFFDNIDEKEKNQLLLFKKRYANITGSHLIEMLYQKYTYYAINSEIKDRFLTKEQIERAKPINDFEGLYTIGYESKKFEEYLNELIKKNISVLVDVRKNAHSMKYGFSKNTLKRAVENLGMDYVHIPELGIESENRKELHSKADYDALFAQYAKTLVDKKEPLKQLYTIIKTAKRVAITCFEKDVSYCHRGVIAKKIHNDYDVEIHHL